MDWNKLFTLTTKQIAIFKLAVLSLGIIIGIHWGGELNSIEVVFWLIFLLGGARILRLWLKQNR